jgi:hypothetical protein
MLIPKVARRPQEIYVPIHAVLSNISFLQGCTPAEEHWKQAPSTIKLPNQRLNNVTQMQIFDDTTAASMATTKSQLTAATTEKSVFDAKFALLEASMTE